MTRRFHSIARGAWSLLTSVPGRPSATAGARLRRALPIAVPSLGIVVLTCWQWGIAAPRTRSERAARQPLISLEHEVRGRESAPASAEARTLRERASEALGPLPRGTASLARMPQTLSARAAAAGWQATIRALGDPSEAPGRGALLAYAGFKGNLRQAPDNSRPWPTLLPFLGAFSGPDQPIDVTRLAIRADEQGRYSVEMRLSIVYVVDNQHDNK